MGTTFVDTEYLESITCCNCGTLFAMPQHLLKTFRGDPSRWFYCPNGHKQHFSQSEADRLRKELERSERKLEMSENRIATTKRELSRVTKAHKKMRVRVMNGVCPCCNRSFENLRQHMATKHPEFGKEKTLHSLREAFGMTQTDVAEEAGVNQAHVSNFEHGKPVAQYVKAAIERWMDEQAA